MAATAIKFDWKRPPPTTRPAAPKARPDVAPSAPPPISVAPPVNHSVAHDATDRAVLAWIDAGRPIYRSPPPASQFGGPDGWAAPSWIARLRQLATTCAAIRPDIATQHRAEADRIETEMRNGP